MEIDFKRRRINYSNGDDSVKDDQKLFNNLLMYDRKTFNHKLNVKTCKIKLCKKVIYYIRDQG